MLESWAPGAGVAYVDHNTARIAVERWHYSRTMPTGKLIKFGVWEHDLCVGVIVYGRGATPHLAGSFGVDQTEIAECVRIAMLDGHDTPVSQALMATVRVLRRTQPDIRVLVSFADIEQDHHGGVYQAANWVYTGTTGEQRFIRVNGRVYHPRSLGARYGKGGQSIVWLREHVDPNAEPVPVAGKHRYVWPMDRSMRRRVERTRLPYPTPGNGQR